jgi:thiol-disulfide isomerase/thioredoxin
MLVLREHPMFQFQPKLIAVLTATGLVIVTAVYLMLGPQINGASQNAGDPGLQAYAVGHLANFRALGTPAEVPDLEFLDGGGKTVHLSDFRGKVVLLNLWATWCVPCREEMPALDALQGAVGSDRFQVLALSVDKDGLEGAEAFLKEVNATHLGLYNDPTSSANFKVKGYGLPTTLLLSADGREVGRIVGPAEWNTDEAKALVAEAVRLYGR